MEASRGVRELYSRERLAQLTEGLDSACELLADGGLCVYATGSYGRLEAWKQSDIDLFFLYEDGATASTLSFIRVAALLIETTELLGYPPFSGDGKYLESLDVSSMEQMLGSPQDDQTNAFTARMLLLLESQPVSDERRYVELLKRIVGFYFRDLPGHENDFVPAFLINDILRFWRTLTLNYEHDRFKARAVADPADRARARSTSALKNYKLKHSRMATCFSMIAHLSVEQPPVQYERVLKLCRMTPHDRFEALLGRSEEVDRLVVQLRERYEAFLACVQRSEDVLLAEFADDATRRVRLDDAARYGDAVFELLALTVPPTRMRQLVI